MGNYLFRLKSKLGGSRFACSVSAKGTESSFCLGRAWEDISTRTSTPRDHASAAENRDSTRQGPAGRITRPRRCENSVTAYCRPSFSSTE
jgi:hypothetical protein